MLVTLFTIIVFIAELIIATAVISKLFQWHWKIVKINDCLEVSRPKIKSVMELISGISEQIAELVPIHVEKYKQMRNKILLNQFESLISSLLFMSINIKVIKKLRKSKIFRTCLKGLSLMNNMI